MSLDTVQLFYLRKIGIDMLLWVPEETRVISQSLHCGIDRHAASLPYARRL